MKDSGVEWIGEIPESWNVIPTKRKYTNLKEIVGDRVEEYERLSLTLNGVLKRPIDDSKGLQPKQLSTYQILYKNELIFKLIDLENIHTSRVGYSPYTGLVSPVYIRLNNSEESKYGFYYFTNMWYQEIFNYLGSGVRSNLTATNLLNVPYISVPKYEQQKIVNFLDKKTQMIDEIIADTKQSIVELKAYKQSIITEAVTKGLNPNVEMKDSGVKIIGKIPAEWNVIKLGFLGSLQNGISKSSEYFGSGFPFVSYGDVYNNRQLISSVNGLVNSSAEDRINYSVKKGDIFFTRTSETIREVGMTSVCLTDIPDATFAGFLIRFRPTTDVLLTEFAEYYFQANFLRDFFAKEMNLVIRASLSQPLLKRVPVLLPDIREQRNIVNFLNKKTSEIDELLSDKEQLISEYESYKKSLIYEYVTGKKQVK